MTAALLEVEALMESDRDLEGPDWLDPDALYEIVDGQWVEKEPVSASAMEIAALLDGRIRDHAGASLGRSRTEQLIAFPGSTNRRRPDLVFVSYGRWPKDRKINRGPAWTVLPELCVEVISPTDRFAAVKIKMAEYFDAGVSQVWIITPDVELLEVYSSMTASRGYKPGEQVDCSPIIPGFQFDLADVL